MKRILVVEDDLALSTGLCFELDAAGYASLAAYNCAKASYLLEHEVLTCLMATALIFAESSRRPSRICQ